MTKKTNRRRFPVVTMLVSLAVSATVIDRLLTTSGSRQHTGQWRSQGGFTAYKSAYDEAMASLPVPDRTRDVSTDFGSARVYEWTADENAPSTASPVVLVPGIRSGVPMWSENLPHWIGQRPIYAMDAIGDAGMCSHTVPFESFDHQVEWLEQALRVLGLEHAHMVGHSFGGAIAATHALHHPERVATVTLLEPVRVLHRMPVSTYAWSAALLLPAPQTWKDRALAAIGGVTVDEIRERTPVSTMVDAGTTHYDAVTLVPRRLTDSEWQSMDMPIRVDIAAAKSLAGG